MRVFLKNLYLVRSKNYGLFSFLNRVTVKIVEVLNLINEARRSNDFEEKRLIANAEKLATAFDNHGDSEIQQQKPLFFRKMANFVEDKLHDLAGSEGVAASKRFDILKSQNLMSFSPNESDLAGLQNLLADVDSQAYSRFLKNKQVPEIHDGYLKAIMLNDVNYQPTVLKRGPKPKSQQQVKMNKDRQIRNDVSRVLKTLAALRPGTTGPYEILLCLVYNGFKNPSGSGLKGDILIKNRCYEVKADGDGAIDAGYKEIEEKMKKAQGSELMQLRQQFEQSKKNYEEEIAKCTRLAENFAKVLARKYNLDDKDVKNYFEILTHEDQKRAIVYGFVSIGYKNIIICKRVNKTNINEYDVDIKVVKEDELMSYINGNIGSIVDLGIDVVRGPAGTKTCKFGDYRFKMI